MSITDLVDLASIRYGGSVLWATDDFFASKDNLLKAEAPIFLDGKYTDRGKWMDGWESRRKRVPGHDVCIVRLGLPGIVRGVLLDTAFFRGNYPEAASIEATCVDGTPSVEQLLSAETVWEEIMPRTNLHGDSKNLFDISSQIRATHIKLHIYPDGGVARLRVFGDVSPRPRWVGRPGTEQEVDLAAVEHGGAVISANDMFFGSRHNLIGPGRSVNMGDGWETKRSRREGPDSVIVKLGAVGTIHRILVDTNYFKGNFPESCAVCGVRADGRDPLQLSDRDWHEMLPRTKLEAHTLHDFESEIRHVGEVSHARLRIWPDGGVSRLRLLGIVSSSGKERVAVDYLNSLPKGARELWFRVCNGSKQWSKTMANAPPYSNLASLLTDASRVWNGLSVNDWDEAFSAHPQIGQVAPDHQAMGEQASVVAADDAVKKELARVNEDYLKKFGRIYIVCASGKSALEMLELAKARMNNDAVAEVKVAAQEQEKITALRICRRLGLEDPR